MRWKPYDTLVTEIEVLFVPDCPNLERVRRRLRDALDRAHIDAAVRETEVATPGGAARLGMKGSPTILIDGHDPFAAPGGPSLSCRLYAVEGTLDGAPSVDQLVAALPRPDER